MPSQDHKDHERFRGHFLFFFESIFVRLGASVDTYGGEALVWPAKISGYLKVVLLCRG